MKPAGKTPYEIRLELLQLATTILMAKHQAIAAHETKHSSFVETFVTTSPTTEEIVEEARKLNTFVSNSDV